jgi:hypothetical protein
VPAKVTKLVGLKNGGRVSPTNLIIFACTQNGEYFRTKKRTRHNHTNFATEYKNSCIQNSY